MSYIPLGADMTFTATPAGPAYRCPSTATAMMDNYGTVVCRDNVTGTLTGPVQQSASGARYVASAPAGAPMLTSGMSMLPWLVGLGAAGLFAATVFSKGRR